MITIKKLSSLPQGTKIRKCARLLEEFQNRLVQNLPIDLVYLKGLIAVVTSTVDDEEVKRRFTAIDLEQEFLWPLSDALFLLQQTLSIERGDWDFHLDAGPHQKGRLIYPFKVVLDRLRSPFNVGSIFRSADSFGVEQFYLIDPTASPLHPRALRSGRGCQKGIPWQSMREEALSEELAGQPVFALESGGRDLNTFNFPQEGVVIVGSEELGVSPAMLAIADDSLGRVTIPLFGTKGSLNVSVAFGILMHVWFTQVNQKEQ